MMQDDGDAERENSRLTKHYRLSESDPQASDGGRDGYETLRVGRPMRQHFGEFVARCYWLGRLLYYWTSPGDTQRGRSLPPCRHLEAMRERRRNGICRPLWRLRSSLERHLI